jgi:cytochrome c biogenesis protein CcmG/thiol:disulfide interchange protein DsbE
VTTPASTQAPAAAPAGVNRKALGVGLLVVLPLLAVLVLNLGRDPHTVRSPLIGQTAPPFRLQTVESGEVVTLDSLRGKPIVMNFWATWCVPCHQEHPALVRAARALGADVHFLGVVYEDDPAQVRAFLAERGSAYPSLLDEGGRTAIAYGVAGVPETYFIDAAGRVVDKFQGALDPETLARLIARASGASR